MAYFLASSKALHARPTALAATAGLVMSKAPMAILKPAPSAPSRFFKLIKLNVNHNLTVFDKISNLFRYTNVLKEDGTCVGSSLNKKNIYQDRDLSQSN